MPDFRQAWGQEASLFFLSSAWAHSPPGGLPLCFSTVMVALLLSQGAPPSEDVADFGLLKLVVVQALYLISFTTFSAGRDPRWTLWFLVLLSLCCVWNSHSTVLLLWKPWHVCHVSSIASAFNNELCSVARHLLWPTARESLLASKKPKAACIASLWGVAKTVCFSNASH